MNLWQPAKLTPKLSELVDALHEGEERLQGLLASARTHEAVLADDFVRVLVVGDVPEAQELLANSACSPQEFLWSVLDVRGPF